MKVAKAKRIVSERMQEKQARLPKSFCIPREIAMEAEILVGLNCLEADGISEVPTEGNKSE